MKKLLTLALVGAMLTATGITAFAENTNVTYVVDPSYTVSIPAAVTLSGADVTADITASDVILEDGKQIKVDLTAASNTASGSTFNAKNGDSTVAYTITADSAVAVGDTVATFTADGSKTLTFSAADKSAATVAGAHTETLTFGISVEDAAAANPYATNVVGDVVTFGSYDWYIIGKSDDSVTLLMKDVLESKAYNDIRGWIPWENCSLRTYLNGEFYNRFNDDDKANIALTHNTNPNNGSVSGGNETDDYIYLLSIEEASALSETVRNTNSWWWLRSPGLISSAAAAVNDYGEVDAQGSSQVHPSGVRPALTLKF